MRRQECSRVRVRVSQGHFIPLSCTERIVCECSECIAAALGNARPTRRVKHPAAQGSSLEAQTESIEPPKRSRGAPPGCLMVVCLPMVQECRDSSSALFASMASSDPESMVRIVLVGRYGRTHTVDWAVDAPSFFLDDSPSVGVGVPVPSILADCAGLAGCVA